jgi:hypothetical protein
VRRCHARVLTPCRTIKGFAPFRQRRALRVAYVTAKSRVAADAAGGPQIWTNPRAGDWSMVLLDFALRATKAQVEAVNPRNSILCHGNFGRNQLAAGIYPKDLNAAAPRMSILH